MVLGRAMTVAEHNETLDGQPVFWRSAPVRDGGSPILYVHGVPTTGELWTPFLEQGGGVAVDLPGFGRSTKRGDLDASIEGYGRFLDAFTELTGIERLRLVVQDWGAVGLAWAARHPERIERLVVMNAVPLLPGYRWHRIARLWRTPLVGELAMGLTVRPVFRAATRGAVAGRGGLPDDVVEICLRDFDVGTQRAILRLYRGAGPAELEAAGTRLGDLTCPALVAWGDRDPYIPARFADAYAGALGGAAEVRHLPDAGHFPWLDRPELVTDVFDFLSR
jgi:pimeloyl-ACP methyl ester carboxylesterase